MSAPRSQRRREKRQAAKGKSQAGPDPRQLVFSRLRQRVRLVLVATSLVGLILLSVFKQPVASWMEHYGLAARLALVILLLCPALLTWAIGLGELKDVQAK